MTTHSNAGTARDFAATRSSSHEETRAGLARRLWCSVYRAWFRAHTRRALRDLPEHLLADVGLTRDEVGHEMNKPFWR